MKKPNSIHFVGIKGVGMTPLAIIAKEAGISVTGSDVAEKFITDSALNKAGINPLTGFAPDHINNADLVITTGAHGGFDNPEVKEAQARGVPILTKGEAVGEFMDGEILGASYKGISVAGTHGKTTSAAMIATIFTSLGKDPAYLIGTSEIPSLSGMPGHFGTGQFFIAEADEYATEPKHDKTPQFWHQHPLVTLVTNIEHDHPDIYPTIADVRSAFLEFVKQLGENGILVMCGDGEQAKQLLTEYKGNTKTYGFSPLNDYIISDFSIHDRQTIFSVRWREIDLGTFTLQVAGKHNALNALGAGLVALELGLPLEEVKKALHSFTGTKRRLEYRGKLASGTLVYDDYAHHPTEVQSTLKALSEIYPEKNILCIFQPHTYSRTKELFVEFARSFTAVDRLILLPIFASAREADDPNVTSSALAEAIKERQNNVFVLETLDDVIEYIDQNRPGEDTLILTMGAGDVYKIIDSLQLAETNDNYSG